MNRGIMAIDRMIVTQSPPVARRAAATRDEFSTRNPPRVWIVLIQLWFAAAALYYLVTGIEAILRWAPHALYADQWRQYVDYLSLPFPQNILHADNGHRLVLPNFIAWIELKGWQGNQWLQIAVGILSLLGTAALIAGICLRDRTAASWRRAAGAFAGVFAIFWLGNARTLTHSTELLHTSLPMLFLAIALHATLRATEPASASKSASPIPYLALALCAAALATFSFGYGMAVFVAILAALAARKAPRSQWLLCLAGLGLTLALYVLLPGGDGVRGVMTFAPLENVLTGARWLGAPFVELFKYLLEPDASGLVPGPLRGGIHRIATSAAVYFPNPSTATLPYAAFGAFGMLALIAASLRSALRREATAPMQALGLGIAWLGLTAAAIVSVSRLDYFRQFPDQIYANRYLPWPCLFWLGLALVALGNAKTKASVFTKTTFAFVLLLPLVGQPTQHGGRIYAQLVRGSIDNTAAGSEVGVIEKGASLGETQTDEFLRGIDLLKRNRVAQFATRAATRLGHPLPDAARVVADATLETRSIDDNAIGPPGTAVVVRLPAANADDPPQLLLLDAQRDVVGIVNRDARLQPPGYSGYARCHPCDGLRAAEDRDADPAGAIAHD